VIDLKKAYILAQIAILACMFLIPYSLLREARGIELFAFWSSSAFLAGILALFFLKRAE
jgi:hypothetical protein